jgi:hypothetical protein
VNQEDNRLAGVFLIGAIRFEGTARGAPMFDGYEVAVKKS